ncbi:TadE/TadG family protein [Pelagerythrobacter marensis]|uniref:TadE/TadG family protein n=1 Tax=Pelagerythrobacter marensis TaxID=543877 RepID=A0ABZ2D4T7_9SPHN
MGTDKLFAALGRDKGGNTLAIVAASIIPLIAIVGGGVDTSRAYLTKTQLQNACDAGVLAGRRAMAKTGEYESDERAKAASMFNANFDSRIVNADQVLFTTQAGVDGDVLGTASARIPTVLMKIFGKTDLSFSVNCMAELQITNSDIMFVLDTTGSMAGTRIQGLRDAVKDFHKTIASSVTDDEVRVRYGFVPYSMTVNARRLLVNGEMPMDYIADSVPYQSRRAYFETPKYIPEDSHTKTESETYSSYTSREDCKRYWNNDYPQNGRNPETWGAPPGSTTEITYSKGSWTHVGNGWGVCKRQKKTVTVDSYKTVYESESLWRYAQTDIDVSALKSFGPVEFVTWVSSNAYTPTPGFHDIRSLAVMEGTSGLTKTGYTWEGCIEERATVVDEDMDPVPSGATDLDINSAPDSDETRWKPYFAPAVFYRDNYYDGVDSSSTRSSVTSYCPAPMRLFQEVDLTPDQVPQWLEDYLDDLNAVGGTYHDIGMIWGGRLASPNGIFATTVNDEPDRSVSRHIIFMTDGEMAPETNYYSAYGLEKYDNRVAPRYTNRDDLPPYHDARFVAACNAIKSEGYTVWVIGFGSSLTDEMKACATGHRAYFSSDVTELRATFRYIASQVADLRLGQ